MKISFILGDWARNIGNAFFQLGGLHVLKTVLPHAQFAIIGEQPGYPSYWNPRGGNPPNYFDMAAEMDTDMLVLMGPMFRPETPDIWGDSLEKFMNSYRKFLKKYPPALLTSRDTETFEQLGDLAQHAYDGIDLAFFLPEIYQPVGFVSDTQKVVLNFDKIPEPEIRVTASSSAKAETTNSCSTQFHFNDQTWLLKFPEYRTKLANRSRYLMFLEGLLFRGPS